MGHTISIMDVSVHTQPPALWGELRRSGGFNRLSVNMVDEQSTRKILHVLEGYA